MAEQDGRHAAEGSSAKDHGTTARDLADSNTSAVATVSRPFRMGMVSASSANLCGAGHGASGDDSDVAAASPSDSRPPSVRRKFRTLTFGRRGKSKVKTKESGAAGKKQRGKGTPWSFKFSYRLKRAGAGFSASDIPEPATGCDACICTGYRRTEEHHLGAGVVFQVTSPPSSPKTGSRVLEPAIDLLRFNPDDYPIDDWEERARAQRARELEEGVDPPPGYRPPSSPGASLLGQQEDQLRLNELAASFQNRLAVSGAALYSPRCYEQTRRSDPTLSTETHLISQFARVTSQGACVQRTVHTQVDYIHCLVPDLREITDCGFYWGKMDRYEAEKLLESKPEGTFLLRDSAQEEYLFSVSFRRYGRSLHARVEQWNHRFSFDSHDPGVFASETVCGLIEHYKDPSCCMFFEPMLTIPLHRTFPFPLQHLCRSVICETTSYDGVNELLLPKSMKAYLKEYHYKQRVRVRRFEMEH